MPDDVAKLKADLHTLNCHIQAERNNEVRHGLQRGRLEAERAQLLVNLMDALAVPVPSTEGYRIVMQEAPPTPPPERHTRKPDGLPTLADMVVAALKGDGTVEGMRPRDIAALVRRTWPDAGSTQVSTVAWRLAKKGRLHAANGRYRLAKPNGAHGAAPTL